MKQLKIYLLIMGFLTYSIQTIAQSGGNGPERFYNVVTYKADITLTFKYRFSKSELNYTKSVVVSQEFKHTYLTIPGQMTTVDQFQLERGDKVKNESHKGDIMDGVDMNAVSKAAKNSGIDPSVIAMLNKTKGNMQSSHLSFNKYKSWIADPLMGGKVSSNISSNYSDEESGTAECNDGEGSSEVGPYNKKTNYQGNEKIDGITSDINNINRFIFQLNLENNSYSFSATVNIPEGFKFMGNTHNSGCGKTTNEPISIEARSFLNINNEKEGLVYKNPLPDYGMILSGSKIITDRFNLWDHLDKEGSWSVKIDWSIYPVNM